MTGEPDTGPVEECYADLAVEILARPARLGPVRLIAVDGPSGAGKSTFADRLGTALTTRGAAVATVRTDDLLDGWEDQFTFWPRLEECVLGPLAQARPAHHPVYDWHRHSFATERTVPVPDVLILEGATSSRPEAYPRLSFSVFVTAPRSVRWRRVLARDGPDVAAPLWRWMDAEDEFFAANEVMARADRVVDGVARVGHDPESGYVRLL